MNGFILAAGCGSRLSPLTDTTPKPLLQVGGTTLLERADERLRGAGARRIVANVSWLGDMIIDKISRDLPHIEVSDERSRLLDTGGGLLRALEMLPAGEPVAIWNADVVCSLSLRRMLERHLGSGADVTMAVNQRRSSRRLLFDTSLRMRGWMNRTTGETLPPHLDTARLVPFAFCGISIVNPAALLPLLRRAAQTDESFPIIPFYTANCHRLDIQAFPLPPLTTWLDVGKPATLALARTLLDN